MCKVSIFGGGRPATTTTTVNYAAPITPPPSPFETAALQQAQDARARAAAYQQQLMAQPAQAPGYIPPELAESLAAQQRTGQADIMTAAREMAGRRGLGLADSPIFNATLREQGRLQEHLAGQRFGQSEQVRQFGEQLRAQQIANLGQLAGGGGQVGVGLAQTRRPFSPGTTQTGTQQASGQQQFTQGLQNVGQIASGIGGLAGGLGSLFQAGRPQQFPPVGTGRYPAGDFAFLGR